MVNPGTEGVFAAQRVMALSIFVDVATPVRAPMCGATLDKADVRPNPLLARGRVMPCGVKFSMTSYTLDGGIDRKTEKI